ncbi:MAG TPA: alpha/beta hydrolase [Polyangiaceae bacterium]|jgi:pimeloyl-ACP methyl ester carboxylesterase|nr:alpha/beta hydrolase [Polyangiaceae bacterium]
MSTRIALVCSAALLAASAGPGLLAGTNAPGATAAAPRAPLPTRSGREQIDGIDYYYELHGAGEPLLLLHGGLGSIDMLAPVLGKLAQSRQVIAVDLQGHGRTPLGARPFRLESIGDDMAELTRRLGFDKVDVMGYSLGGGVALRLALQKPEAVRRLVLVSTPFSDAGFYPEIRAQQAQLSAQAAPLLRDTPMYQTYAAIAPDPADFPRLLETLGAYMKQHYDWSAELRQLKLPVMLVYGDGDMFLPEHEIRFYQLLGGGQRDAGWQREHLSQNRLAILPDLTHYDIFTTPRLATTVLPFLDGQSDAKSWQVAAGRK